MGPVEPFAPPGPRPCAPETPSQSNPEPVVLQGLLQPGTWGVITGPAPQAPGGQAAHPDCTPGPRARTHAQVLSLGSGLLGPACRLFLLGRASLPPHRCPPGQDLGDISQSP